MWGVGALSKQKPERVIESEILNWLHYKKIFCWKNVSGGWFDPVRKRFRKQVSRFAINGTSDVLGVLKDGRFLAIEVKAKYGKASPEQLSFIDKINSSGGIAFIAKSVDDVSERLKDYV